MQLANNIKIFIHDLYVQNLQFYILSSAEILQYFKNKIVYEALKINFWSTCMQNLPLINCYFPFSDLLYSYRMLKKCIFVYHYRDLFSVVNKYFPKIGPLCSDPEFPFLFDLPFQMVPWSTDLICFKLSFWRKLH